MKTPHPVHEDFKDVPVMNIPFNRIIIGAINLLMGFDQRRQAKRADPDIERSVVKIPSSDGNQFKTTVMRPKDSDGQLPVLIYYHGGAFAMTYASLHLDFCEQYAKEANCCVLLVDYRLAPKHPFPAGFNDCYSALEWVIANADSLKIDTGRIAVGGDSAGGAFSAGVAQKALDNGISLCGQMLVYPVMDSRCETESARTFPDVPLWNSNSNRRMWDMYLKNHDRENAPAYAAPGERAEVAGLPAAYVETAEFDPLRDEGQAYAKVLSDQGIRVETNYTLGTIHGYEMAGENPATAESLQKRFAFLRSCFNPA